MNKSILKFKYEPNKKYNVTSNNSCKNKAIVSDGEVGYYFIITKSGYVEPITSPILLSYLISCGCNIIDMSSSINGKDDIIKINTKNEINGLSYI